MSKCWGLHVRYVLGLPFVLKFPDKRALMTFIVVSSLGSCSFQNEAVNREYQDIVVDAIKRQALFEGSTFEDVKSKYKVVTHVNGDLTCVSLGKVEPGSSIRCYVRDKNAWTLKSEKVNIGF